MVSQVALHQLFFSPLPALFGELQVYLLRLEVQEYIFIADSWSQIPTNG
jgi:hypothetical protein